jgi:hypothetical protein
MSAMSAVVATAPAATTATATASDKNQAPVAAALPGPPATPTVPPPAGVAPPTPTFADDTLDDLNDSARNALLLVDHAAESETESEVRVSSERDDEGQRIFRQVREAISKKALVRARDLKLRMYRIYCVSNGWNPTKFTHLSVSRFI